MRIRIRIGLLAALLVAGAGTAALASIHGAAATTDTVTAAGPTEPAPELPEDNTGSVRITTPEP